jgi:hypothetical protein
MSTPLLKCLRNSLTNGWLILNDDSLATELNSLTNELSNHIQSQSYFTTGGLLPIISSWPRASWDSRTVFSFSNWTLAVIAFCNVLSDKKMGLSFTIVDGLRHLSRTWVRISWVSWPHFTFSYSRLPQTGGSGSLNFIAQEQGGWVILPGTGLHFVVSYDSQG